MFSACDNGIEYLSHGERIRVEAWGEHAVRIRATRRSEFHDAPSALIEAPRVADTKVQIERQQARFRHGHLEVIISDRGTLSFHDLQRQFCLLYQTEPTQYQSLGRSDLSSLSVRFAAHPDECFYGLGQHRHGFLNQKGCVVELQQRNCEVTIPLLLSSRGYALLWNHPGTGRVELANNGTHWHADAAKQLDLWFSCGPDHRSLLAGYTAVTGRAPRFPEWASGFWQCKLRYANQQQLLAVAREYKRRHLPISVIVIDYFHWPMMGDFCFDPDNWPDPQGMVDELRHMGIELMISVWPTINAASKSFAALRAIGGLLETEQGTEAVGRFVDTHADGPVYLHHYDPSHPQARQYLWQKITDGYRRHGIRLFWLDACEPEVDPPHFHNLRFHLGNGAAVACHFPKWNQQTFFEGLRSDGEEQILTLCRSAWAGSQRYAAAVWSGDIPSTFESLQAQVRAGLNIGLSGIPWWTTDIGGFYGGDPHSDYFRELIVRWFQFGVFCPIFRLHGKREPGTDKMGADNEVWAFGDTAYPIICELMALRERLRPYIHHHMQIASGTGAPLMRPLFFDFPEDGESYQVEDQFMFGDDLLIAPVLHQGQCSRRLYLPRGSRWRRAGAASKQLVAGGQWLEVEAPLSQVPVFCREGKQSDLF